MSNELEVVGSQPQEMVDMSGMGDVVRVRATNLTLVQNTTQDPKNARPGQILDELSGQGHDKIVLVPLRIMKQRVMFEPGSDFGGDPLCRSNNGIVPDPKVEHPKAKACATCRFSQWLGGKRPACSEKLRVLAIVKDTGLPRWFTATGKGITPTMNLFENFQQNMISANKMAKPGEPRVSLHDFYFTLEGEKVVNKTGVFYIPRYSNTFRVQNLGEFNDLYKEYVIDEAAAYAALQQSRALVQLDEGVTETVTASFDVPFEQV
jgi:hypothetical protein